MCSQNTFDLIGQGQNVGIGFVKITPNNEPVFGQLRFGLYRRLNGIIGG